MRRNAVPTVGWVSLLLAVLGLAGLLPARPAAAAEPLRLVMDAAWSPRHAVYFSAIEAGHFARAEIAPVVEPARGGRSVAVLVGQGAYDLGQVSAVIAATAIASGAPLRMVAVLQPRSPLALVGIAGRITLAGPWDIRGLRVGATPATVDGMAMAIFRRANALGSNEITVVPVEAADERAALIAGQVDAVVADAVEMGAALRAAGHAPTMLDLAAHGVPLQGLGLVASQSLLAGNPSLVRRALAAIRAGHADAAADPQAACVRMKFHVALVETEAQCAEALRQYLARTMAPDPASWGNQAPEVWTRMIAAMRAAGEIRGTRPASSFFTNAYLP